MLITGDARKAVHELPSGGVALVVTSPPYNVGVEYPEGRSDALPAGAYWQMLADVFEPLLTEKLMVGGRLAVNWPGYAVGKRDGCAHHHRFATMCGGWGVPLLTEIVWDQQHSDGHCQWGSWLSSSAPRFPSCFEYIQVWCRGSVSRTDKTGPSDVTRDEFMAWTEALWRFPGRRGVRGYPATFPRELPERLIKLLTWPNDLVADPFCGTGTTLVAAKALGRRWWGCDVSPRATQIARERIATLEPLLDGMEAAP